MKKSLILAVMLSASSAFAWERGDSAYTCHRQSLITGTIWNGCEHIVLEQAGNRVRLQSLRNCVNRYEGEVFWLETNKLFYSDQLTFRQNMWGQTERKCRRSAVSG